jgi:hypothetical protein
MNRLISTALVALSLLSSTFGCSSEKVSAIAGTSVVMEADAELAEEAHFFDFPYPSDFRLDSSGHPDLRGFPNPSSNAVIANLLAGAMKRPGFPVIAMAYFRFAGALPQQDATKVLPKDRTASVLLIDIDPASPEQGKLFPVATTVLAADSYVPANVLATSTPTGIVLHPRRKYAFVVQRSLKNAAGELLGSPLILEQLKAGQTPDGASGARLQEVYASLWPTLDKIGVPRADVAAATVFTTTDVVQDLADMTSRVTEKYSVQIVNLRANPGSDYPTYCDLVAEMTVPQFQRGTSPFNTEGQFEFGDDGMPIKQGEVTIPVHIALPKSAMPAKGFPLMLYVHGSGGTSMEFIDRGYKTSKEDPGVKGGGPAMVVTRLGIAAASSAMPVNPERGGTTDYAYLNFENLAAFPSTFHQGVIEQRLFLKALKTLEITSAQFDGCANVSLPQGATAFKFDPDQLVGMGHSMGAMYLNMLGSVEPRIRATVMHGAGGYWMNFIFQTGLVPGATTILAGLFGTDSLSVFHPVMNMAETAWEPAEPLVYTPRVARRPLPGHPARPIYQPIGTNDAYFPEAVLDDMTLAYGNQQAGEEIWSTLQPKLAIEALDGIASYPVSQNRTSTNGSKYTGVAVQFEFDGILSGHNLAFQLDSVKHQYGCFLSTFLKTGTATVVAPGPLDSACE